MFGRCRWIRRAALAAVATTIAVGAAAPVAGAHPIRGHVPFSVIVCKFSDQLTQDPSLQTIRDFMLDESPSPNSVAAYWRTVSYGLIDLQGTEVVGPYTMPITYDEGLNTDRWTMIQTCVKAAGASSTDPYTVPAGNRVVTVVNDGREHLGECKTPAGSWNGEVLANPCAMNTSFTGHETGHALGLGHSFSTDTTYLNSQYAQPGEYDDEMDIMSCMHCSGRATTEFSPGAPGLIGPYLDRLGWIAGTRLFRFGADGATSSTITLTALSNPDGDGYLLARIPFDPADLFHYYYVELRAPTGVDAGVGSIAVRIHEVKDGVSYLVRSGRDAVESLDANGVTITTVSKDATAETATVSISGDIADQCLAGYVKRAAGPTDHVCVTPARQAATAVENSLADSRRSPNGGAFGADTCLDGFVWRGAFDDDHVCVPPATRRRVARENRTAARRKNPARFVYGPNTCKVGYVWREADDTDYVCVTPATRAETRDENSLAESRREPGGGPYGPNTCQQGFVWRLAFPSDLVCVLPSSRSRAEEDNAAAEERVENP
jgi:hypothetical protein